MRKIAFLAYFQILPIFILLVVPFCLGVPLKIFYSGQNGTTVIFLNYIRGKTEPQ
jgi:hypothetical protein